MIEGAAKIRSRQVELHRTLCHSFPLNPEKAVLPFIRAAQTAEKFGLGLNAGLT